MAPWVTEFTGGKKFSPQNNGFSDGVSYSTSRKTYHRIMLQDSVCGNGIGYSEFALCQ